MTSVTNVNCLPSKEAFAEVLRRLRLFDERLPAPSGSIQQGMSITSKETLAGMQSADLEAFATLLRSVLGLIDILLLERQLAECGFDAVRAASVKTESANISAKCP
jgi:hypothetical protein